MMAANSKIDVISKGNRKSVKSSRPITSLLPASFTTSKCPNPSPQALNIVLARPNLVKAKAAMPLDRLGLRGYT